MNRAITSLFSLMFISSLLYADSGKKVFESYCWGCHHQTATAFGPSFAEIASKRDAQEIKAMITDPDGVSKEFGYKRNAMPKLNLKADELNAITEYILSYKEIKKEEDNITKEQNKTIKKGFYMLDKYFTIDKLNKNSNMEGKELYQYFFYEDNEVIEFEIIEPNKTIKEDPYPNIASKERY